MTRRAYTEIKCFHAYENSFTVVSNPWVQDSTVLYVYMDARHSVSILPIWIDYGLMCSYNYVIRGRRVLYLMYSFPSFSCYAFCPPFSHPSFVLSFFPSLLTRHSSLPHFPTFLLLPSHYSPTTMPLPLFLHCYARTLVPMVLMNSRHPLPGHLT